MKNKRLSTARAVSQILFWVIFIGIIVLTRETSETTGFLTNLPRLSAYLGISLSLTAKSIAASFLPALIIIVLTIVFGRFFCGWICPLGSTIDATDKIITPAAKSQNKERPSIKSYKFLMLIITLALSIVGIQVSGIFDPLSLAIRSYGTVIYAYFDTGTKLFFESLYHVPGLNQVSEPVYSLFKEYLIDYNATQYHHHLPVFFLFFGILFLSIFARRFWCRALCPLGAIYALTSRIAFLRRSVDVDKCIHCLDCVNTCRMDAIHEKGVSTHEGECIKCFECLKSCKFDAIQFKFSSFKKSDALESESDNSEGFRFTRKNILRSFFAIIIAIPIFKRKPGYTKDHSRLIRPPGALKEQEFINTCVRCGQCMKVCPTNAIHPLLFEYGLDAAFTPRLIPRIGSCELNCKQCSEVCPSGALKKISKKEKEKLIIGTAYFIKDLCIPYANMKDCMVCEEMCPTPIKAIVFRDEKIVNKEGKKVRVKLPYVLEDICIGCGICENKCPITGSAAIQVRTPKNISPQNSSSYL